MKEAGQVVVFRFPQTDLEEGKLRPALLLSKLPGNYDDWLICMISSQTHQSITGLMRSDKKMMMTLGKVG